MNKPAGLPASLRTKLASLARRIRLLRALRGFSLVALTLVLLPGGLFVTDLLFGLPPQALRYGLLGIAGTALLVVVFGLVVPLCRRLDLDGLAALIEQRYPELGERLTTTVELADQQDQWHGSRALIAILIDETERRASPLNFARAFPARSAGWLAVGTSAALLAAGVPALVWGDRYEDFGRRLVQAWAPPVEQPVVVYTFQVNPGNSYAARGRPLHLLALVHADHGGLAPISDCTLVYTDGDGKPARLRMPADPAALPALAAGTLAQTLAPGTLPLAPACPLLAGVGPRTRAFTHRLDKLSADLAFHVEAGGARSDNYRITAVEPVELAADSPAITIEAPDYASKEAHPKQTLPPLTDLFAFEFGRVRFDLRFMRPAVAGRFEVAQCSPLAPRVDRHSRSECPTLNVWRLPLTFAADRHQAHFEMPALRPGAYDLKLILEAEHGITTAYDLRPLTIRPDEPPVFTQKPELSGLKPTEIRPGWVVGADPTGSKFSAARRGVAVDQTRAVAPGDTLKLRVTVEDTVGVGEVELEFRLNDGPSHFRTVARGAGQLRAEPPGGEYAFTLPPEAKDDDVILFRVRARDNRRVGKASALDAEGRAVPAIALTPQTTYFPERAGGKDRWYALRVNSKAEPLAKQEILAQRDQVRQQLDAILKKLTAERNRLTQLRNESRDRPVLTDEQKGTLQGLREDNREVASDLNELAELADRIPALQPLAHTAEQVAARELTESGAALAKAQSKGIAARREQQLQTADQELARAQQRLGQLSQENDKLAQRRLDQLRLEQLAARQQQLARRAAELGKAPVQELDSVRAEQNRLADELSRLAQESELLRQALDATRAEQAQKLAEQAKELAQAQRDLTRAAKDGFEKEAAPRLAELVRRQQELAEKAAELARQTALPARTAAKPPLRPDDARHAADALKQGDVGEALQKQDQAAKELDRAAQDFEKAGELPRDLVATARQLAKLQDDLRQRFTREAAKKDPALAQRLQPLKAEQEALQNAIKALPVPRTNQPAKDAQRQAADRAADAAKGLAKPNPQGAVNQMQQAREALQRLADNLQQRRQQALDQLGDLRRQQEDIGRQTENALKQAQKQPDNPQAKAQLDRTLADAARRQAQVAERLGKLDLPGQEARQQQTEKALNRALGDLIDRQAQDVPASQQSAREELKRLEKALRGEQLPEDKAGELARRGKEPPATQAPKQTAQALAQQQRQLAQATQKAQQQAASKPGDQGKQALQQALGAIAKQQAQLNQQAGQLEANKAQTGLEKARRLMAQAQQALQKNDSAEARRRQQEAADALDSLARKLPDKAPAQVVEPKQPTPLPGLPTKEQAAEARKLAQEQKALRDAVQKAAEQMALTRKAQPGEGPMGELTRKQNDLAKQTGALMKDLGKLAQEAGSPQVKQTAAQAAQSAKEGQDAMKQAQAQAKQGNEGKASQASEKAAQALDRAAQQAAQAAQQMQGKAPAQQAGAPKETGQALKQGQEQMAQAQSKLGQGQPKEAQGAMQKAANALQQAAQQLQKAEQSGQPKPFAKEPGPKGAAPFGLPDLGPLSKELKKYAGRSWGELPGELRTRILQDMRARYGEDYAGIIQRYFEQIADTNRSKRR
ncbi:MAG: hypothetical protein L0Z62_26825 [Gemmataceae bacterium]|nr:hypothetical protein [Gemmataceae bacterium]